jgi:hypothetical protein
MYSRLLRFYPKKHRERFSGEMEQTFNDLCGERERKNQPLGGFVVWVFLETIAGILKENIRVQLMLNKRLICMGVVVCCLLMIPWFGRFPWTPSDYIFAGVLLSGTCLALELLIRRSNGCWFYRLGAAGGAGSTLLLLWVNAAVGIIGSENNPANMLYVVVPAVGLVGALLARLRPAGLSLTFFSMALAQVLVPIAGLLMFPLSFDSAAPMRRLLEVVAINGFFATLFTTAGLFFRLAARRCRTVKAAV